jgi:phage gpG-like protein
MTRFFSSPLAFAAHLVVLEHEMKVVEHAIIARACEMVAEEARRVLGTEGYNWTPLAASTLAHKMQSGMLLESGAMRASIEWHSEGNSGEVGSNSDVALFQELGTSKIPPRSFLGGAAAAMGPAIEKLAARAVVACIAGKGLASVEMRELLHFLHAVKHAIHAADEKVNQAIDYGESR